MSISERRRAEMLRDLQLIKLQLDNFNYSPPSVDENNNATMGKLCLTRAGSVRGRRNLVRNLINEMNIRLTSIGEDDAENHQKIIVYLTSCGVLRRTFEKCRIVAQLLEAHRIRFEVRDLNIDEFYVDELMKTMQIEPKFREIVFEMLPLVYIDGFYIAGEKTLVELNDRKLLTKIMGKYQQTEKIDNCLECGNRGYVVCQICHGKSRRQASAPFALQLKCAFCDKNGISRCTKCRV